MAALCPDRANIFVPAKLQSSWVSRKVTQLNWILKRKSETSEVWCSLQGSIFCWRVFSLCRSVWMAVSLCLHT